MCCASAANFMDPYICKKLGCYVIKVWFFHCGYTGNSSSTSFRILFFHSFRIVSLYVNSFLWYISLKFLNCHYYRLLLNYWYKYSAVLLTSDIFCHINYFHNIWTQNEIFPKLANDNCYCNDRFMCSFEDFICIMFLAFSLHTDTQNPNIICAIIWTSDDLNVAMYQSHQSQLFAEMLPKANSPQYT